MSSSRDYKVGTAEGQTDGLQVLGVGEPWPTYLEGMEEWYILELIVITGLSHSVNLGIAFLMKHKLKMNCTEEEVELIPLKGGSSLRARLVDGGYHSVNCKFIWS